MKQCTNCGVELEDNALFCGECGTKQTEQKRFCENCGVELQAGEALCPECGTPAGKGIASAVQIQAPAVELSATSEDIALTQPDGNTICISVKGISFNLKLVEGREYGTKSEIIDFYIGETPVTQALWLMLMGENPSKDNANILYPVTNIDQSMTTTLLVKLQKLTGVKFELPTKEQWEFAYKGGNRSKGCKYAGSNNVAEVGWVNDDKLHPVGELFANELGLCDMDGNVDELLNDGTWAPRVSGKKASVDSNLAGVRLAVNIPVGESVGTTTPLQIIIAEYQSKLKATRDAAIQELKIKEEEEARIKAEEEAKRKAEEAEKARIKAEEDAKRKAEEAERARIKAEEDAKRKTEAEAKRAVKREAARKKAEENARIKAEENARQKAEKEARIAELQRGIAPLQNKVAEAASGLELTKTLLNEKEQMVQTLESTIQESEQKIAATEKDITAFNRRFSVILMRRVDNGLFNSKGTNFDNMLIGLTGATKEQINNWNQELKRSHRAVIGEQLMQSDAFEWKRAIEQLDGQAIVENPYDDSEAERKMNSYTSDLDSANLAMKSAKEALPAAREEVERANADYKNLLDSYNKVYLDMKSCEIELAYLQSNISLSDFIKEADADESNRGALAVVFDSKYEEFKRSEEEARRKAEAAAFLEKKKKMVGLWRYSVGDDTERDYFEIFKDDYEAFESKEQDLLDLAKRVSDSSTTEWKPYITEWLENSSNKCDDKYDKNAIQYTIVGRDTLIVKGDGDMPNLRSTKALLEELHEANEHGKLMGENYWCINGDIDKRDITKLVIIGNITAIGSRCFLDFNYLETVVLPDTLASIGFCAFFKSSLQFIKIPDGVKKICDGAFYKAKIKHLYIPRSVEFIEEEACTCCPDLSTVLVPESTELQKGAKTVFADCNKLKID